METMEASKPKGWNKTPARPRMALTDEQVLRIRARSEFEGATRKELLAEYPGMTYDYLRNILEYSTRSKLIPKRPRA